MKRAIPLLAALFLLFAGVGQTKADSIVGDFDLDTSLNTIPSVGQVTFTLNVDGTIAASLVSYVNAIVGFGFDSTTPHLFETNFSPPVDNADGWLDAFGYHPSGFYIAFGGFTETWTIGNPGDYTSALQALGGHTATTDFFLIDSAGNQFGAMAESTAVPEPSALALLAAACIPGFGYFGWRRRQIGAA